VHALQTEQITVPGSDRWTQEQKDTYLAEMRELERQRLEVGAERQRIDSVRRKMIEKINDIEELESSINREKRQIVCGLLERRETLMQEYTSVDHAQKHIAELRRDVHRMEGAQARLPAGGREQIEIQRSINEKKYDIRVWEEGLAELKKVEAELAGSDVFSWSQIPEYCDLPAVVVAPAH
jgi:septal ring factor EnvC (AmiA/AmiB activator)